MDVTPFANNIKSRLESLRKKPDDPMYSVEVWKIVLDEAQKMVKQLAQQQVVINYTSVTGLTSPTGPVSGAGNITGSINFNG
ncbi:MAG: hypothetical protein QW350_04920 [Candidatus Aenigmatarchaeota archaeon]|jgi:hypothetical protein